MFIDMCGQQMNIMKESGIKEENMEMEAGKELMVTHMLDSGSIADLKDMVYI
jgi:hypothetical protein